MPIIVTPTTSYQEGDPVYATPGTGLAVPRGVEAWFQFNGLVLGNSTNVDKFRILDVGGLNDADVRDSREVNPSSHGETAFTPYYAGRTITISGRIEAHNMAKLRDMQMALRSAFGDLGTYPLTVLTGDSTRDHYIKCRKSAPIAMGETQQGSHNFFRDFMVTLRAADPRWQAQTVTRTYLYPNRILNFDFETDVTGWSSVGTPTTRDSNATQAHYGTKSQRVITGATGEGCTLTSHVVCADSLSHKAQVWVYSTAIVTLQIDEYTAASSLIGSDSVDSEGGGTWERLQVARQFSATGVKMNLQVYTKAGEPSVSTFYLDETWLAQDTSFDAGFTQGISAGNFESPTTITVYGDIAAPTVSNDTSQQSFEIADIIAGDYYLLDSLQKTVVNSSGVNKFGDMMFGSDFIDMLPTTNVFALDIASYGANTVASVEIAWRSSWI